MSDVDKDRIARFFLSQGDPGPMDRRLAEQERQVGIMRYLENRHQRAEFAAKRGGYDHAMPSLQTQDMPQLKLTANEDLGKWIDVTIEGDRCNQCKRPIHVGQRGRFKRGIKFTACDACEEE